MAESDSSTSEPSGERRSNDRRSNRDDPGSGRQMLLEEARTTTNQQLGQINKNEGAAVRTVRITLVLSGLLAGGTQFPSFPDLGLSGIFGLFSLVGSLVAGLFVYGTTKLFIGARPDELSVDYTDDSISRESYVEVLDRYEDGVQRNQRLLYANGFGLATSRFLLALAVVFVVWESALRFAAPLSSLSIPVW